MRQGLCMMVLRRQHASLLFPQFPGPSPSPLPIPSALLHSPATPTQGFLEPGESHLEEPAVKSAIFTQTPECHAQRLQARIEGHTAANQEGSGAFGNSEVWEGNGGDACSEYSF